MPFSFYFLTSSDWNRTDLDGLCSVLMFREPIWWSEMLIPLQFAIMRAPVAVFGFPIIFMNTISLNDTLYMNMLHTL